MALTQEQIEQKYLEQIQELRRLEELIENDIDSNGKYILDDYPYRVILEQPFADKVYDGCLDWVDNNIAPDEYYRAWVTRFYFKNEEDATAFKLRWT